MVLPEGEFQASDEEDFRRRVLSILGDLRDTNERICRSVERVLNPHPTDPRYKEPDLYRPRLHPSEK